MPDKPSSYEMRDWKKVARIYDSLVFDLNISGEYFPVMTLGRNGVNYSEIEPIFMDSYVGSSYQGQQREAINIIPAIVGATLVGADKTTQFDVDWVSKIKDFYNLKNGELVYLNGPSDKSGHDWWYETMPNIFFYQLYDLYPDVDGFQEQFISVADRWLEAVKSMGAGDTPWAIPDMNHRAWNLTDMMPLEAGVKEPEAAGAIAWILYQGYVHTADKKYLIGAQWALDFLNTQTSNPSYELQLPYGVLTAAKLNAEFDADYDIEKMVNWCFSRGDLRGWGSVVGTWGEEDVSGLIGEANDQGNDYVFIMNGFQQAAALAPLVKYDKRFTRSIAKWILNVSNASRLFYSNYLPENQQSDYGWSQTYDPNSVIAYEAIKENWEGVNLYARGDAKAAGWANTNLALYGSSHVGYLGALIEPTDIEGILQVDLNVTDFYSLNEFPTYLYFNPYAEDKNITLEIGEESKDLYDAISETLINSNISGSQKITIPPNGVLMVSLLPAESDLTEKDGKLVLGESVIDYHYGYNFQSKLRIKSLASTTSKLELGSTAEVYCTISGDTVRATYKWFINGKATANTSKVLEITPNDLGEYSLKVSVSSDSISVSDSITIQVVELIPEPPVIQSVLSNENWYRPGEEFTVTAEVADSDGLELSYLWYLENGELIRSEENTVRIRAINAGVVKIRLEVSRCTQTAIANYQVLVVEEKTIGVPLLQLSMNETAADQSENQFDTKLNGGIFSSGPTVEAFEALKLSSASDELLVINDDKLNFQDQIGISLWANFSNFSEERFLISHGSWEKRWKLSTTSENKVRWTINTTDGIKDLDSRRDIEADRWYYIAVAYDGYSLQLYIDGTLDAFLEHSGLINQSDVGISLGKRLAGDEQYDLNGILDEVRVYDHTFDPLLVRTLMNQWSDKVVTGNTNRSSLIYPNPTDDYVHIPARSDEEIEIIDREGRILKKITKISSLGPLIKVDVSDLPNGVFFIRSSGRKKIQKLIIQK